MADPQTPASIIAAARALIPLVATLSASDDPTKQAQANQLNQGIRDALNKGSQLAADDVVAVLGNEAGPLAQLQKFDQEAQTAAATIAKREQNVANAISFCTNVVAFAGAVATGNAIAAATQLSKMLGALNIG